MEMESSLDYLRIAYDEAIKYSTDPSTQNGAILVSEGRVIARGSNHFPKGVLESPERWERPLKYNYVEHAERNAIYAAARSGEVTRGAIMYCPWFACTDCARAIIQAGVKEVIGHDTSIHLEGSKSWQDSIAIAYKMLEEAGVKYQHIKGHLGIPIRFNGNIVEV